MLAHATPRRLFWFLIAAIVILLLLPLLLAASPNAAPPIGTWSGVTDDGRSVSMVMTEDGGFYLKGTTAETVRAVWTWTPIASGGGMLHCQPADWPTHRLTTYYVVWLDANRIELSNYYFRVVLERMV